MSENNHKLQDGEPEEPWQKAERLKSECGIDEWLLEQAIRIGNPRPILQVETKFDPSCRDLLVRISDKYRKKE